MSIEDTFDAIGGRFRKMESIGQAIGEVLQEFLQSPQGSAYRWSPEREGLSYEPKKLVLPLRLESKNMRQTDERATLAMDEWPV